MSVQTANVAAACRLQFYTPRSNSSSQADAHRVALISHVIDQLKLTMCAVTMRVGALQPALQARRRSCIVRAAQSKHSFNGEGHQSLNTRVLEKRIALLQSMEAANRAKAKRPSLPQNTLMWNELEQDHKLIVEWHEQAWRALREQ